jgi:hypothetical protein
MLLLVLIDCSDYYADSHSAAITTVLLKTLGVAARKSASLFR